MDKRHFYAIARGSTMECGAVFDVRKILGIVEEELYREGKALLKRIV